jgi:hypothetical protein
MHRPPIYYGQWNGVYEAWLRRQAILCTCAQARFICPATAHCSRSSGNPEPSFVIPTCIAVDDSVGSASTGSVATKKGPLTRNVHQPRLTPLVPPRPLQVALMTSTFSSGMKRFRRRRTTATSALFTPPPHSPANLLPSGIPFSTARLITGT